MLLWLCHYVYHGCQTPFFRCCSNLGWALHESMVTGHGIPPESPNRFCGHSEEAGVQLLIFLAQNPQGPKGRPVALSDGSGSSEWNNPKNVLSE